MCIKSSKANMHPLTILQKIIENLGASLVKYEFGSDGFGSGSAIYLLNSKYVRVIWDGKDGWGFLQHKSSSGLWVDASPTLDEGDLEGRPQNHIKIAEFKQVAAALLSVELA
jgi:hypothetical protein